MKWFAAAAVLACSAPAFADKSFSRAVSGPGTLGYIGLGVALPFLRDGSDASNHGWRTVEALGLTILATEAFKRVARVKRPDAETHDSFPSGHASAAFVVATMQSQFHPNESPLWYGGASLIGWSRVDLGRHRPEEVAAGALLGFSMGRLEASRQDGILIAPYISGRRSFGIAALFRF